MNTLLKSGFLAGFLLISASLMSKDRDFSLSFGATTAKTVNFEVLNAQNISLVIYNEAYGEVFSEKLGTEESVTKSYNLSDLASGMYFLVAESEQKIEKFKIKINADNTVDIEKTPFAEISKPEYTMSGSMVKLHLSGLKDSANISVTDFSDNIYYSATKKAVDGDIDLTFDLSLKTADKYIITVEEGGNVFNKIITLN
ncbi:Por secretion system C-terminal sorting domain-containing protein [Chryseobacterium arachidis]|uniref:Por secretion system C-terminal sorting domain-containing protein n=1 Tax=Chryseobacterium arachidis TaxID=1416778 RepID=A0A1M5FQB5_9FLAO|nr:T9SS type A sorting domain-containing protein [Chryseobacterium arachidis]SHF93686.1 Por secretion system C-terminal sorting domain-containing protein [Chryseobacterium arachidis]